MSLSNPLRWLKTQWSVRPWMIATSIAVGVCLPRFIRISLESYRGYLALRPGGLPHNVWGWLIQTLLQPIANRDTINTTPLTAETAQRRYAARNGLVSYLPPSRSSGIPLREGTRPTVPGYVAPQRQITEEASLEIIQSMEAYLAGLAAANPELLALQPSHLEAKDSNALWLANGVPVPDIQARAAGEMCHIHPEGSSHVVLSLKDGEDAVRKGWAERHMLSGVLGLLPVTYLFIYAPRNDDELNVWKDIVLAGARFVTNDRGDVKAPE